MPSPAFQFQSVKNMQKQKDAEERAKKAELALNDRSAQESAAQQQSKAFSDRGKQLAASIFGSGALGRYNQEEAAKNYRSGEISDVLARRKAALAGLEAPEGQALKEKALEGLNEQTQTGLRQLRGAQGGISPVRAAAQQAALLRSQDVGRGKLERDLLLENVNIKNRALSDFEQAVRAAEAEEQARLGYNIDQSNKEKYGQLAAEMGFEQLAQTPLDRLSQQGIAEKQANAARVAAAAGGKK